MGEPAVAAPAPGSGRAAGPADLTGLGLGLGWRPEIAVLFERLPGLRFTEVVAESLPADGSLPGPLTRLRERGVTVVPHGTRLSLGGVEPLDPDRVRRLARAAEALDAPLVSEHIAFVRAGGWEAGHLLPLPRTREALDVLTRNVRSVQAELGVSLALEPIAAVFDWLEDEYTEADFVTALLDRTGARLLLDVANVYANARNRGRDPWSVLDRMPLDRVAYLHVAGGAEHPGEPGIYHDTHTTPPPGPVLDLLAALGPRLAGHGPARPVPARHDPAPRETTGWPPVLLERDGRYPPQAVLRAELDALAGATGLPEITS